MIDDSADEIFDLIRKEIQKKISEVKKKAKEEGSSAKTLEENLRISDEVERKINIYHQLQNFIRLCDDVIEKRYIYTKAKKSLLRAQYILDQTEIEQNQQSFQEAKTELEKVEKELVTQKEFFKEDVKLKKIFKNLF